MLRSLWYWLFPPLFILERSDPEYADPDRTTLDRASAQLNASVRDATKTVILVPSGLRLRRV